jgi:drug/metabolite transporter (DMT)-like permease
MLWTACTAPLDVVGRSAIDFVSPTWWPAPAVMNSSRSSSLLSVVQALAAALLFGSSAPLAKVLLGGIDPIPLAGFLYLGSGLGLALWGLYQRSFGASMEHEAQLKRPDIPWLIGSILAGGIAAPIILLFGLHSTPAATASLLLNFEAVATTLIAALAFREAISRRAWLAVALITLACILLSLDLSAVWGISLGAFAIAGACVLWGIDNNLTQRISAKDPLRIVTVKGLAAGSFSLLLALALGSALPPWHVLLEAMLLGTLSYGLSILLFVRAMRGLGAARTSALFGTAPFAGMLLSFVIFRELPPPTFAIALPFMIAGALLLLGERHEHYHVHDMVVHEHAHNHEDGHHEHDHSAQELRNHSNLHEHDSTAHDHHHMPDLHHRHIHRRRRASSGSAVRPGRTRA